MPWNHIPLDFILPFIDGYKMKLKSEQKNSPTDVTPDTNVYIIFKIALFVGTAIGARLPCIFEE